MREQESQVPTEERSDAFSGGFSSDPELEAMLEAGVHLGHVRAKRNAGMVPYLWGIRNNVEIIDLIKTKEKLYEAFEFVRELGKGRRLVLFVGTRPAARDAIRDVSDALGQPYVNAHWVGGTLTNFKVVLKRVELLESLEAEDSSGGFGKYPKHEQAKKRELLARLRNDFEGLRRLRKLPDALVVVDIKEHEIALREAGRAGVPVIGITDSDTDPRKVRYPIPANDDARQAVVYLLGRIRDAFQEGERIAAAESATIAVPESNETQKVGEENA